MPPQKPTSWTGVKDCFQVANRAPQDPDGPISEVFALDRREPMGEDCLAINVFTPALGSGNRPVMVWLHGGGFSGGSGNWLLYDGTNLARKEDVVVVSVTHRLNLFGFLHLSNLGAGEKWARSSNVGMRTSAVGVQRPGERHPLARVERRAATDLLVARGIGAADGVGQGVGATGLD